MIARYQDAQIDKIWSLETKANIWWEIEKLVLQYWKKEQLFSLSVYQKLLKVQPDIKLWKKKEKLLHHEVGAFLAMLEELSPENLGKWWHYGLTSNDIIDTGQNFLLKKSYQVVEKELVQFLAILKTWAWKEKNHISLGRTHGMAAEPITIGIKFALWFQECNNHFKRLKYAFQEVNYVKILGPTGISAHFSLDLAKLVSKGLKMQFLPLASQIMSRDHYIAFFNSLTNLATTLEKIAMEIRNLSRSEIGEIREGFTSQQQGSSAMPHKKNPFLAENICALMRMLRAINSSFYHTNLIWHERDLTNSALERNNIPDFFHLLVTGLKRINHLFKNLVIEKENIKQNLEKQQVAIFSHKILLFLLKKTSLSRQQAYYLVQKASFLVEKEKLSFREALEKSNISPYFSAQDLKKCLDINNFFSQLNIQFKSIFD